MPAARKVTHEKAVKCHFCFEKAYVQWGDTAGCPEHEKQAKSRGNGNGTKKTPKKSTKKDTKKETSTEAEVPSDPPSEE